MSGLKFNFKWIVTFLTVFFLVTCMGQMAMALDAEDYPLGDIPMDQAAYDKLLKPVPQGRADAVPASYDARNDSIVTPAKDQGSCGSCWAHASVGAMESHILKQFGGSPSDLSEQQQNRCNTSMAGCSGGSSTAPRFWETRGPITEACYPYTATDGPCNPSCTEQAYRVTGFYTVTATTAGFKQSLYDDGPSYWRYNVYSDFNTYWNTGSPGAVYTSAAGASSLGGHAVLIIGWDDNKGAFLCKNSWGQNNGPNGDGTFWIAYSGHYNNLNFQMSNFILENNNAFSIDIKANGSDGPVTISQSQPLSIAINLNAGGQTNNVDWWVLGNTPMGWYRMALPSAWVPGIAVTHQGPLFDLPPFTALNATGLPLGDYTFYFGVDTMMNGSLDLGQMTYDSVNVSIANAGSAVGTWSMNFDWDCDGNPGNTTWYINSDGTWTSSGGYNGTWTQVGDQVTIVYSNGTTYTGTINPAADYMSGTMIGYNGGTGCWTADRTTLDTQSSPVKGSPDAAGN